MHSKEEAAVAAAKKNIVEIFKIPEEYLEDDIWDHYKPDWVKINNNLMRIKSSFQDNNFDTKVDVANWPLLGFVAFVTNNLQFYTNASQKYQLKKNDRPTPLLHYVALGGNLTVLQSCMEQLNSKNFQGVLKNAARGGNLEMVKYLLRKYINIVVTEKQIDMNILLRIAVEINNLEMVKYLIADKGVNITTEYGDLDTNNIFELYKIAEMNNNQEMIDCLWDKTLEKERIHQLFNISLVPLSSCTDFKFRYHVCTTHTS